MRHLKVSTLFVCFAALLFVFACADNQQKPAETSTETTETPKQTAETPSETAAANIEEVTLAVTGMTWGGCTSAVQSALSKVTGVSEVVSVSMSEKKAVVKIEKGKVTTDALVKAVEADPRFKATVAN